MKKKALALMILFVAVSIARASQPREWTLSITSGGAPWEKRFTVELDQSGQLVMTESPDKTRNDPVTEQTVKLSPVHVKEIYDQTLRALFSAAVRRPYEIADGTRINIKLSAPGRVSMRGYHVAVTEEEVPQVAKLFALINKHLPKEHQIY